MQRSANSARIRYISMSSSYLIHALYCCSAAAFTCHEVQQLQLLPKPRNKMQCEQGKEREKKKKMRPTAAIEALENLNINAPYIRQPA